MENQKETPGVQPWYLVLRLLAILGLPYLLVQLGEAFHIWARIDQIYYLNKVDFFLVLYFSRLIAVAIWWISIFLLLVIGVKDGLFEPAKVKTAPVTKKDVLHIILGFFTVAPVGFEALIRIITSNPEPYLNF